MNGTGIGRVSAANFFLVRLALLCIVAMLASTGWGAPAFDASSGNAQASVDAMKAEMTEAEQAEFDAALQVVDVAINSIMWEVQLLDEKESAIAKLARIFLHGKTAVQFVAAAERACEVFHPNELVVQMVCEKMREAAVGASPNDPAPAAQGQEQR